MQIKAFFLGLVCSLFLITSFADELIVEPDSGRTPIITAMNNAKNSVQLVIYGLTDTRMINELIQTKRRGKDVQVILEPHPYRNADENTLAIKRLQRAEVNLQDPNPDYKLTHQKTLLIDHRAALIMTFNFTHATFDNQRNFALLINDPAMVQEIEQVFSADVEQADTHVQHARLVWSPENSRHKILELIQQARMNIKVYAAGLTDYQVVGALAKAARAGISVQVLTTNYNSSPQKALNYLKKAGVDVQFCKKYVIHAKVIIIDQQRALLGSVNFTRPSINQNRELSVMTEDPKVVKQLVSTFEQDWDAKKEMDHIKIPHLSHVLLRQIRHLVKEVSQLN